MRVGRVAPKYRYQEADFIPVQGGEDVLGDVGDALACRQSLGEGGVHEWFTKLRLRRDMVVEVYRDGFLGEQREPGVVGSRYGASQRVLVDIADLEEPSPLTVFYTHLAPQTLLPQGISFLARP